MPWTIATEIGFLLKLFKSPETMLEDELLLSLLHDHTVSVSARLLSEDLDSDTKWHAFWIWVYFRSTYSHFYMF